MSKDQTRVLCVGDVLGQFEQLSRKLTVIDKKNGPFDILFCVGEFFGPNAEENENIIDGKVDFPVPTYVLGPCCSSTSTFYPDESVEFSSSVTYLGKRGILNTASGLQVAYLSGVEGSSSSDFQFSEEDVEELLLPVRTQSGFLGVDVLLTSSWPDEHAHNTPSTDIKGSRLISRLAAGLKPRYHFAGMGIHYERQPYRNHRILLEPAQHVTRFIGLAPVANEKKQKWLYAFSIQELITAISYFQPQPIFLPTDQVMSLTDRCIHLHATAREFFERSSLQNCKCLMANAYCFMKITARRMIISGEEGYVIWMCYKYPLSLIPLDLYLHKFVIFSIGIPMRKMSRDELTSQPPNSSEFPYMDILEELMAKEQLRRSKDNATVDKYRFDMSVEVEDNVDRGGKETKKKRSSIGREVTSSAVLVLSFECGCRKAPCCQCWRQLLCCNAQSWWKHKGGEVHRLPLLRGHIQSLVAASDEIRSEVEKFKNAFTLVADKDGKCLVCFERNYRTQHLQVQMVPIPKNTVKALRNAFLNAANLAGIEMTAMDDNEQLTDLVNEGCPYFFVEMPDGSRLFTRQMKDFPLQFAREVLASRQILNCEAKTDWRKCTLSKEEEIKLVKNLQARFKPFDFTSTDDSD